MNNSTKVEWSVIYREGDSGDDFLHLGTYKTISKAVGVGFMYLQQYIDSTNESHKYHISPMYKLEGDINYALDLIRWPDPEDPATQYVSDSILIIRNDMTSKENLWKEYVCI